MRYVRSSQHTVPAVVQIARRSRLWRLRVEHACTEERHPGNVPSRPPHAHDLYHVVLYCSGENAFLLGEGEVACRSGTLALTPPGVPHEFAPARVGSVSYREITFELTDGKRRLSEPFNEVLSEYVGQRIPSLPLVMQARPGLSRLITQLVESFVTHATGSSPLGMLLGYQSVAELLGVLAEEAMNVSQEQKDVISEARRHLLRRFAEPLGISQLAGELGITQSHLSRAFRARYGVSPAAYRQDLRISAAVRMLSTGSLSCKEVAMRLGFADVQTFTKAFARQRGQTPGKLARNLMGRG